MNSTNWFSLAWQIPIGLLVLSFLVLVHELGHFCLARWNGVTVHAFSIGFGPRLFGVIRGGTDYKISAIPFGGYVLMAGEEPSDIEGSQIAGSFDRASLGARAAIVVAGPLVNILFALFAIWMISMTGVREPSQANLVVAALDSIGPGVVAGIQPGDTILEAGGRSMRTLENFYEIMALNKGKQVPLKIRRSGDSLTLALTPSVGPDPELDIGWSGVWFGGCVLAHSVIPNGAADSAGLVAGDTLLSLDGFPLSAAEQLTDRVKGSGGRPLSLFVGRSTGRVNIALNPRFIPAEKRYMIGIQATAVVPMELRRYGPIDAAVRSVRECWHDATGIFRFLGALVSGALAPKNLAGPVGIVQMSGRVAAEGWQALIEFMAMISINLGILNLMPLIITDGGKLVELAIEKIRGQRANRRIMEVLTNVVVYCFLLLALYVTFHDIIRIPLFLK